jgi:hypothetical protein
MVKALFAKVLSRKMAPHLGPHERLLTTHASNPTSPPVPEPVKMNYITPVAAVEQHAKEQVRELQKIFPKKRKTVEKGKTSTVGKSKTSTGKRKRTEKRRETHF